MNIFLFELKSQLKSQWIWILSACGVAYFFMLIYPAFYDNAKNLIDIFNRYPKEVLVAFGFDMNQLFSALGFYSFVLVYVELITAMQAMILGLGTSGRELRLRTSDFLITKPVKRVKILLAKVISITLILVLTNIFIFISAYLGIKSVTPDVFSIQTLIYLSVSTFLLQWIFASIGVVLGVTFRRLRSIAPVSLGIVFGFFVVNMLKAIFDDAWIRYVSPFQFFDKYEVLTTSALDLTFVLWSLGLVIIMLGFSFIYFDRKDIHAV